MTETVHLYSAQQNGFLILKVFTVELQPEGSKSNSLKQDQLGVERDGKKILFHDDAPLASTRIAMTYGTASSSSKPEASIPRVRRPDGENSPAR
jgi:hypothetical protein